MNIDDLDLLAVEDFDLATTVRRPSKRKAFIPRKISLDLDSDTPQRVSSSTSEGACSSSSPSVQSSRSTSISTGVDVGVQVGNPRRVSYNKKTEVYTYKKLLQVFFVKESTIQFCFDHGLLPSSRQCPVCGRSMTLISDSAVSDGKRWYCRQRKPAKMKHEKRLTIRSGTIFERSNMTLEEVLEFVYLWVYRTPVTTIHHEMGLSSATDVDWASFCREVMESVMCEKSSKIGGPGVIVEIDESKFAKRKYNRDHALKAGCVFGGREKDNKKKVFLVCVPERTADTLTSIIRHWIVPGSIIWSYCSSSIPQLPKGYQHATVNNTENFKDPVHGVYTNHIESDWRKARAQLPDFGSKETLLPGYLASVMWHRYHEGEDLFLQLLKDTASVYPVLSFNPSSSTTAIDKP